MVIFSGILKFKNVYYYDHGDKFPIFLQTSLKLALHCIQIFNDSGSQLCEEDLSRLGMWLYQMKIEYVVIKDIIKKLREKQLRIRNGRIDYIIPYI